MSLVRDSLSRAISQWPAHPPERFGVLPCWAARIAPVLFCCCNRLFRALNQFLHTASPLTRRAAPRLALVLLTATLASALPARPLAAQTPNLDLNELDAELISREAQLIAAVNVERQKEGLLPLRWNRNLSDAARWFARDAVLTRATCGHTDSLQHGPGTRIRLFGYKSVAQWGEAVTCGFTEPNAAVAAWMYGEPQRSVLMSPTAREAGAGYYWSEELGRGYVVFDSAADATFAPAVINNEMLATSSPQVTLTVHPQPTPAVAMKVSNTLDFDAVAWEPYATQKAWTLEAGAGWRTVYVLIRSGDNRTHMLSDKIYLGESVARTEISLDQATTVGDAFSTAGLAALGAPSVRLSLDWLYDSSDATFVAERGEAIVESDPAAIGGSSVRMVSGDAPGAMRGTLDTLPVNKVLTAYFRLKVSDTQGNGEVAQLKICADGQEFGPLVLKASDFAAPDQFQEFAIDFAFPTPARTRVVAVSVERTGATDVLVDAVRFFGQPLSTQDPIVWTSGGATFRDVGVLARAQNLNGVGEPFYVTGKAVDAASEMAQRALVLQATPNQLVFKSSNDVTTPANAAVVVCAGWCADGAWTAVAPAGWVVIAPTNDGIIVRANADGMAKGVYDATITIQPAAGVNAQPSTVHVQLLVEGAEPDPPLDPVDVKVKIYLPLAKTG